MRYLTWNRHDCRFSSFAARYLSTTKNVRSWSGGSKNGDITVDMFQGGSRTHKTASPHPAVRILRLCSTEHECAEDSKLLSGKDSGARSIWAYSFMLV